MQGEGVTWIIAPVAAGCVGRRNMLWAIPPAARASGIREARVVKTTVLVFAGK